MMLVPDYELFKPAHLRGESDTDYTSRVQKAQEDDSDSVAILRGEIAGLAAKVNHLLVPRKRSDFRKQVTIADFLSKQKVIVPIPTEYVVRASIGPVNKWVVDKALLEWGFDPTKIKTTIKKRRRFGSIECYVKITFEVR